MTFELNEKQARIVAVTSGKRREGILHQAGFQMDLSELTIRRQKSERPLKSDDYGYVCSGPYHLGQSVHKIILLKWLVGRGNNGLCPDKILNLRFATPTQCLGNQTPYISSRYSSIICLSDLPSCVLIG